MNGRSHRVLGAATFVATLPFLPLHGPGAQLVAGVAAVSSSSGRLLSPDADQGWLWHLIDSWLPDEAILSDNGPMQHRGITHWFAWPALVLLAAYHLPLILTIGVNGQHTVFSAAPILAGLGVGWGSHILGDFLVGAAGQGRAAGVPLGPWWWWIGTGAKCGGITEWTVTGLTGPIALYLTGAHLGLYDLPTPATVAAWATTR